MLNATSGTLNRITYY